MMFQPVGTCSHGILLSPLNRKKDLYANRVRESIANYGVRVTSLPVFVSVCLLHSRNGNSECRVWFDMDLIVKQINLDGQGQKARYKN